MQLHTSFVWLQNVKRVSQHRSPQTLSDRHWHCPETHISLFGSQQTSPQTFVDGQHNGVAVIEAGHSAGASALPAQQKFFLPEQRQTSGHLTNISLSAQHWPSICWQGFPLLFVLLLLLSLSVLLLFLSLFFFFFLFPCFLASTGAAPCSALHDAATIRLRTA